MTPARRFALADLHLRLARARLLLQIARDPDRLADLLTFAGEIGDCTAADSLAAFRAAQNDVVRVAQAALDLQR